MSTSCCAQPRGAVVLDLRDVRGNVFGGDQMNEWTVMDGPHRYTFVNPQSSLYDRIAAVKAIAGDEMPVEGRIVFTRRARFPKGLPKWTLMLDSLPRDFPLIEGGTPGGTDPFDTPWSNIRQAVRPSPDGAGATGQQLTLTAASRQFEQRPAGGGGRGRQLLHCLIARLRDHRRDMRQVHRFIAA